MQDAIEFLLRLPDRMKNNVDARQPATDPVRDNLQLQIIETFMCRKCQRTEPKRQETSAGSTCPPPPPLRSQDVYHGGALRLSMRPDQHELLYQSCHKLVTT